MREPWVELWDVRGNTSRGHFALWGILLVAVKYNLDRLLAASFHRSRSLFDYLQPSRRDLWHLPRFEWTFLLTMIAVSLPVIWAGITLTARRLRDVGWPLALVALFFVPVVNYILFMVLAIV